MSNYKCPVCGNTDCSPVSVGAKRVRCDLCLTVDDQRMFVVAKPVEPTAPRPRPSPAVPAAPPPPPMQGEYRTILNPTESQWEHYPPEDVQQAAQSVLDYFAKRGAKMWAFGAMQSRNWQEPALVPTVTLGDVRRLGAAFRCDVIPRAAADKLEEVMREMQEQISLSREHGDDHDADLVEAGLQGLQEVVGLMAYP